ncbi:MAG: tetratricopeptide repeat protein [Chitinophagaceae bacterium]|nr:tetratricopeptide repeat protein [Chitinophagaceae bacterium]
MNKIIFFVFLLALASCSNNGNNTSAGNSNADMPEQEKNMRDLAAKYPDSFLLKENLIQYFRENSNYGQAIAETEYALKNDSANERLWYMKATLLTENDDTTKAIKAWEQTIRISPRPEYLMSLGTLYAFTKDPLALGMADVLMAYGPSTQYQGLFIKGLYCNTTGNKAKAAEFFDACISIDYTNTLAYREKAIAEYDMGDYKAAIKTLELALTVKKTYDEAYYWLGRCFEKQDKKQDAIESYKIALQLSPDYIEAKDALGKLGVVQ